MSLAAQIIASPFVPLLADIGDRLGYWTPAALVADGSRGFWFDLPTYRAEMFTDRARTIALTAVDQSIGSLTDLNTRGNHHTASGDGNRPVLKKDASNIYYARFDGSDDALITSSSSIVRAVGGATVFLLAKLRSAVNLTTFVALGGTGAGRSTLQAGGAGGRRLDADSFQSTTAVSVDTTAKHRYLAWIDYANAVCKFYKDGSVAATKDPFQTAGVTSDIGSTQINVGAAASIDVYAGLIIGRALTATEIAKLDAYYAI